MLKNWLNTRIQKGISVKLLKNGTKKLKRMLSIVLKYANVEDIPESWKEAWITPIHEK